MTRSFEEGGRVRPVLNAVDAVIAQGAFVVLLGRSGSGKSTLLNLVAGLDAPDSGHIEVAGVPISELGERERTLFRRTNIGFVYQFFNLISTLDVLENVRLPLELAGATEAVAGRAAMEMLEAVGLADRAGAMPDRLSGGEQQRVAIARALVAQPRLVLADEPTGNLDAETGEVVLELLLRLTRSSGRSLIVATHSRKVASAADIVLRLDGAGVLHSST